MLSNTALILYTLFLLLFNTFSGLIGSESAYATSITSANIIGLTNQQREKYGLLDLKNNSKLASAALAKANNMFKEQYWSHFGPSGESPWDFIRSSGYSYVYAGENLAKGFKTAEGTVEAWMASPTHRENLLSGNYKEIGVAVVSGKLLGEEVILVVQMFGNQTTQVTNSPKPDVSTSQSENGQTMSIKITEPKTGAILNDPTVDIKGNVTGSGAKYSVSITDDGKTLGGFESNGTTWSWDKQSDWGEGTHSIVASLVGKNKNSKVEFTIDSRGPEISSFEAVLDGDSWNISGKIDDFQGSANIVLGDQNIALPINASGEFAATIQCSSDKVVLLASDKLGNITQKDISNYFVSSEKGSVLSTFISMINSINSKDTVNGIFLGFILILLIIEIVTYWRKKMLAKHGSNLFILGIWWMILAFGVMSGFNGVIN